MEKLAIKHGTNHFQFQNGRVQRKMRDQQSSCRHNGNTSTSALRSAIMVKTCVLGHCTIQMNEKAGISIHYIHLYNYRQPKAKKRRKL